jgi:anti-anti-sigma factor
MKAAEFDLSKALKFDPDSGRVLLDQDRMLIFRQEALAGLRKLLLEQLGERRMRAVLSQFGSRCGMEDHKLLSETYTWDTEIDELASGPVIHTWEGIVKAVPTTIDFDRKTGHFYMKGIWTNSYEADTYLKEVGRSSEPVCHTLTGYASGWCTSFFRMPVIAIEPRCLARGDETCEFEIKPTDKWGPEADPWKDALSEASLTHELEEKENIITAQRVAIARLSSPILQVWDGIVCLPIVGMLDAARSVDMTERLLAAVVQMRARSVILDVTGLEVMDTDTTDQFMKMARAVRLMGARAVVTGISPEIAQTLTQTGGDLGSITTLRNLRDALRMLLERERRED